MSNWKWNEFSKLRNAEDLHDYLEARKNTHTWYFHYTNLEVLNCVLKNNSIWIGSIINFNDKEEIEKITDSKYKFAFCFSTGVNENLPMWYMYSGISGQGARIIVGPKDIKKIVNKPILKLLELGESNEVINEYLLNEKDYELKWGDILYCDVHDDSDRKVSLKYNTMTNYDIQIKEIEKYKKEHNGFIKNLVWFYEKETRLLIDLKDNIRKTMNKESRYVISMDISLIRENIKVELAPEIDNLDILKNDKYSAIFKFMAENSCVSKSKYSGQIKMDILSKNKSYVKDNLFRIFECNEDKNKDILLKIDELIGEK